MILSATVINGLAICGCHILCGQKNQGLHGKILKLSTQRGFLIFGVIFKWLPGRLWEKPVLKLQRRQWIKIIFLSFIISEMFLYIRRLNQIVKCLSTSNFIKVRQFYFQLLHTFVNHNRGAAAHKGATKKCQGCRQILNLLPFINVVQHSLPQIVFYSWLGEPPIFFSHMWCRESRKVEKRVLHTSCFHLYEFLKKTILRIKQVKLVHNVLILQKLWCHFALFLVVVSTSVK